MRFAALLSRHRSASACGHASQGPPPWLAHPVCRRPCAQSSLKLRAAPWAHIALTTLPSSPRPRASCPPSVFSSPTCIVPASRLLLAHVHPVRLPSCANPTNGTSDSGPLNDMVATFQEMGVSRERVDVMLLGQAEQKRAFIDLLAGRLKTPPPTSFVERCQGRLLGKSVAGELHALLLTYVLTYLLPYLLRQERGCRAPRVPPRFVSCPLDARVHCPPRLRAQELQARSLLRWTPSAGGSMHAHISTHAQM